MGCPRRSPSGVPSSRPAPRNKPATKPAENAFQLPPLGAILFPKESLLKCNNSPSTSPAPQTRLTIAYTTLGAGQPLIVTTGWVSHLELDLENPHYAQFMEGLSDGGRRRIIRFDGRGTGLSDREVTDTSAAARAQDFGAVVDHLGLDQVAIFAWSMSGPAAILYAAEHPEKVSHLILYATFARSNESGREALGQALVDLIRADWRIGSRAIVDFVHPNADRETADHFSYYSRSASSGDVAASILEEAFFDTDVRDQLERLTMPTLVLHRRDDQAFPMSCGRELASLLPHAHFVPLPGDVHVPFQGNSAAIIDAVNDFLSAKDHHAPAPSKSRTNTCTPSPRAASRRSSSPIWKARRASRSA